MRLRYMLKLKNINQKDLSKATGLEEPMISKFNNYVCLPIPEDMKKICDALSCNVLDIYEKNEIQYMQPKKKRTASEMDCYKLTVRINKEFRHLFTKETLIKLGFSSVQDVVQKMLVSKLQDKWIRTTIKDFNKKATKEKPELDSRIPNSDKENQLPN